jgi:hypothetical protein
VYVRHDESGSERKIAVWYVDGEAEANTSPTAAVRPYLDYDMPPEHLLVARDGGVSVIDVSD